MAADTTRGYKVELSNNAAQALWAAMKDDDELAVDYVDYAIHHALQHFCTQKFCRQLTRDQATRFHKALKVLHKQLEERADASAERWTSIDEPPF